MMKIEYINMSNVVLFRRRMQEDKRQHAKDGRRERELRHRHAEVRWCSSQAAIRIRTITSQYSRRGTSTSRDVFDLRKWLDQDP